MSISHFSPRKNFIDGNFKFSVVKCIEAALHEEVSKPVLVLSTPVSEGSGQHTHRLLHQSPDIEPIHNIATDSRNDYHPSLHRRALHVSVPVVLANQVHYDIHALPVRLFCYNLSKVVFFVVDRDVGSVRLAEVAFFIGGDSREYLRGTAQFGDLDR